ncbi:MAG: SulP family inorganic anion transporter [Nitrospinae bacterium]|nr:SulP family inorganic anion transporter [Nitrospinota bacterium]
MKRNAPAFARYFPFLLWWPLVTRTTLKDDLFAGITNAVVVLPQGVAFAMISGLPPAYGLYTAIIPPIIAGLFGSSRHLISGPTTAISIVVFSTISPMAEAGTEAFVALTLTLTLLAGLFQAALGMAKMGALVNFISHSVVVGFTAGAAILIATSQLKHVLGLPIPSGESFLHIWVQILSQIADTNLWVLFVAILTLTVAVLFKKWKPRWPAMLIAMVVGAVAASLIGPEETGIALVGAIPSSLPPFSVPEFSAKALRELTPGAIAVAMLGLIEAVSISRSIATRSGQRIDGNQEFIGQGLSNIIGAFFSSYASSGSFTRSGLNYSVGAHTPMAAVFAALSLAVILLLVAPLAAYLPIPAMGGIVMLVAYNLIDFHHINVILKAEKGDAAVLVTTFISTLFVELEFAIYVGVLLSLILYLNRTSKPRIVPRIPDPFQPGRPFYTDPDLPECPQVKILRIDGSIYFGSVNHVESVLQSVDEWEPDQIHKLIVMSGVNFIDVAGGEMLAHEAARLRAKGGRLYLYGVKEDVRRVLLRGGYLAQVGVENIFCSKSEALSFILGHISAKRCRSCPEFVFAECASFERDPGVELNNNPFGHEGKRSGDHCRADLKP